MKIFISWSGKRSQAIAQAFREWLPNILQYAQPYFTPDDIDKGMRWASEIAGQLEESKVGLLCLTKENLSAPWLMFEAGAISKSLTGSRLCPILFGVDQAQVSGPLSQFQNAVYSKDEVLKFVKSVNAQASVHALSDAQLSAAFDVWWPKLEPKIEAALSAKFDEASAKTRSPSEIAEETLGLVRALAAREQANATIPMSHWSVLWDLATEYGQETLRNSLNADQSAQLDQLRSAKKYLRKLFNLAQPSLMGSVHYPKKSAEVTSLMKAMDTRMQEIAREVGDEDELPF